MRHGEFVTLVDELRSIEKDSISLDTEYDGAKIARMHLEFQSKVLLAILDEVREPG